MSVYLASLARYDEAENVACEALKIARERGEDAATAWALQHLGAIAAFRPKIEAEQGRTAHERAARVLGYVDARLVALGSGRLFAGEQEYDRLLALLRDALGGQAVADLMAEAAAMTEDSLNSFVTRVEPWD
jgi:hypothetical protein